MILHARMTGDRASPVLVFLHGFLGSDGDWDEIVADLAADHYCVALDLPGHGASLKLPDPQAYTFVGAAGSVTQTLESLNVGPAVLIGYSMGGRLALQLALQAPHRWRGLVLESASPGLATAAERASRDVLDEQWASRLVAEPLERFLRQWYAQPVFAGRKPSGKQMAQRLQNDPAELARALRGMGTGQQPPLWDALETLTPPALLLVGAQDAKYVELSAQMQTRLSARASRVIVSASGHAVHGDNPEGFLRAVRDFLRSID